MADLPYQRHEVTSPSDLSSFGTWLSVQHGAGKQVALVPKLREGKLALASLEDVWVLNMRESWAPMLHGVFEAQVFNAMSLRFVVRDLYQDIQDLSKLLSFEKRTTQDTFYRLHPLFVGDLFAASKVEGLTVPAHKSFKKLDEDAYDVALMEPQMTHAIGQVYSKCYIPFAKLQAEATIYGKRKEPMGWWVSYCMTPETPVLTADLRWVAVGALNVGDRLLAFDENPRRNGPRHWSWSTVTDTGRLGAPLYEVEFEDGTTLRCTGEHPWLIRRREWAATLEWVTTLEMFKDLQEGRGGSLPRTFWAPRYFWPWKSEQDYDDGFLAGAFDSEGSLQKRAGSVRRLDFSQKPNGLMRQVKAALTRKGFDFTEASYRDNGAHSLWLKGGFGAVVRLLGQTRPPRLLDGWLASDPSGLQMETSAPVKVKSVREVGWGEVVTLETDTATYLAAGFPVHNTDLWLRVLTHYTGDPTLKWLFLEGRNVMETVARTLQLTQDQAETVLLWECHGRDTTLLLERMPALRDILPDDLPAQAAKLDRSFPTLVLGVRQMQQAYRDSRYAKTLYGRMLRPGHPLGEAVAFRIFGTVEDLIAVAAVTLWQNRLASDTLVTTIDGGPTASLIRVGGILGKGGKEQWQRSLQQLAPLGNPLEVSLRPLVVIV